MTNNIELLNTLYREKKKKINNLIDQLGQLEEKIKDKESISAKEYFDTIERIKNTNEKINHYKSVAEGIHEARELLLTNL